MQPLKKLINDLEEIVAENEIQRPSWEDTYFEIANVVSKRSKDPHTKVGAVLVKEGRVIGIGYNGQPRDYSYDFNWNSSEKYDYVIHAEMNAIANACSIGANVKDSIIYLTTSPCCECIKLLMQFGIKEIHFINKYKDFEKMRKIASFSKIKLIER